MPLKVEYIHWRYGLSNVRMLFRKTKQPIKQKMSPHPNVAISDGWLMMNLVMHLMHPFIYKCLLDLLLIGGRDFQ